MAIAGGIGAYIVTRPSGEFETRNRAAAPTSQQPASYIVWWPGISAANDQTSVSNEMDRMITTYYPEYIYILASWSNIEPSPDNFDFSYIDTIIEEAQKRNIKIIFHIGFDFYGGAFMPPLSYSRSLDGSGLDWFWQHEVQQADGSWKTVGLYDPLEEAMRFPPTCGCNCNNNTYEKDWCILSGYMTSDHVQQTCDGIEVVPGGPGGYSTIKVREHPDLVYSPFNSWVDSSGETRFMHDPYPSLSSPSLRKEIYDASLALAKHMKSKYPNVIEFYNIWAEPTYAHFREYDKEVDYSSVELNQYNTYLTQIGKSTVSQIPNPPDDDYITFRKWNLAGLLNQVASGIRAGDSNSKISYHMFMAGQKDVESINKLAVDHNILQAVINPDIINATTAGDWTKSSEGYDMNVKEMMDLTNTYNKDDLPLLTASINIKEEVQSYNSKYYVALNVHYYKIATGQDMPLTACWASQQSEQDWNSTNSSIAESDLSSAYTVKYNWSKTKGNVPSELVNGGKYSYEFYAVNHGTVTWKKDEAFALGAQWFDENENIVSDPTGTPIEIRAEWVGGDNKVLPGEQQKFKFTNIILPPEDGTYQLIIDMLQENIVWFRLQDSSYYSKNITISTAGCSPDCSDKECGDDGCGGSCGTCDSDETCSDGICISSSQDTPTTNESADINDDGKVNMVDYSLFITDYNNYRKTKQYNSRSDLNSDNEINLKDYSIFVEQYQQER